MANVLHDGMYKVDNHKNFRSIGEHICFNDHEKCILPQDHEKN